MFRTTKCSSSGRLYKQLYSILSSIYINSLVVNRVCIKHILLTFATYQSVHFCGTNAR